MPENDKPVDEERVQAYLNLYKQQMDRFRQTQEVEWKANISLWTLLAGAVYLARDHHLAIPHCISYTAALVVALLHGCWLCQVHSSAQIDKILWTRYRSEALLLLRGSLRKHEEEVVERKWAPSWLLLEIGVTLILATFLAFLATRC